MMRAWVVALAVLAWGPGPVRAQFGGNIGYAQQGSGKAKAEQAERARRTLAGNEVPPGPTATFVEAAVLMNVKADEYVAVFGVAREGETAADCVRKVDAAVKAFADAIKPLGVRDDDLFVDFVSQTRTYGYEFTGNVAREKPVGFELKKNVSVRFTDKSLLDRFASEAARSEIFDLIKVDYVVRDRKAVEEKLAEEAAAVIKRKAARYVKLLGIRLKPPGQVFADRSGVHYPSEMYDSYTAFTSEELSAPVDRQRYAVQSARKSRTFFFNGLDGDGFDAVIHPVVVEPVVQFTLYLKVKYEVEQAKAR
jgi:uncharacterized protein YggE